MQIIKRAKALLGTVAEISVHAQKKDTGLAAIKEAFFQIEKVHNLMSFHLADSDLSKLNAKAHLQPLKVNPLTYQVLLSAVDYYNLSQGIFDIRTGSLLQDWGYLPDKVVPATSSQQSAGSYLKRDRLQNADSGIDLLPDNYVSFKQQFSVDFGGIAKGFAVDLAVNTLKEQGIRSGLVNAGGDLRCFGEKSESVYIRKPDNPAEYLYLLELKNQAIATSCPVLLLETFQGKLVSPLVDNRKKEAITSAVSISVQANSCLDADALTKIVLAEPDNLSNILQLKNAMAYKVTAGKILKIGYENL